MEFKAWLHKWLRVAGINEENRNIIISNKYMPMWRSAFTTKNMDEQCNLEYLEYVGDRNLKSTLTHYFRDTFPIDKYPLMESPSKLSNMSQIVEQRKGFASMAKYMDMKQFVNGTEKELTDKSTQTLEDVFEAFFGAFGNILDAEYMIGTWALPTYNLFKHLADNTIKDQLDPTLSSEKDEPIFTQFKNYFDGLGFNDNPLTITYSDFVSGGTGDKKFVAQIFAPSVVTRSGKMLYTKGMGFKHQQAKDAAASNFFDDRRTIVTKYKDLRDEYEAKYKGRELSIKLQELNSKFKKEYKGV